MEGSKENKSSNDIVNQSQMNAPEMQNMNEFKAFLEMIDDYCINKSSIKNSEQNKFYLYSVFRSLMQQHIADFVDFSSLESLEHLYQSKIQKILELVPLIIVITDSKGNIIFGNNLFCSFAGITAKEMISKGNIFNFIAPQDRQKAKINQLKVLQGDSLQSQYLNITKPEGELSKSKIHLHLFSNKINKQEILYLFEPAQNDFQEEEISKEKNKNTESRFALFANMSHNIRIPMLSIYGFTELLLNQNLEIEKRKSYVDIIYDNCQTILTLFDELIELNSIENNAIKVHKDQCYINKILDEYYCWLAENPKIKDFKKIDIRLYKAIEDDNFAIFSDNMKFRQILRTLLDNSLRFTVAGSIEFGYSIKDDNFLSFFVKDTGSGIPEDKVDITFNRFDQVHYTNKMNEGKTGLGLSICKKNIELLNGDIWFETHLGKGTTFHFLLPYHSGKLIPSQDIFGESNLILEMSLKAKVVLVVEDEENNFRLIEEMLTRAGGNVIRANNGKDALELIIKRNDISVILMDIKLPDFSGYEVTRRVREMNIQTPIIAQTAFAMSGEKERCLSIGCDDYIAKPFKYKNLIQIISKHLENELN